MEYSRMPTEGSASSAPSTEERHRPWAVFIVWSVVGGAYSLALIGILSIGIFVLPVAIVATVLAARLLSTQRGLVGLLAGLGVPPLYVAFLNRGGPNSGGCLPANGGELCSGSTAGTFRSDVSVQSQLLHPWPGLAIGLLLVAVAVSIFLISTRKRRYQGTEVQPQES